MGLFVSVCVSFNCNAFLASLYISNRSRVFNLCHFSSICRIFIVWSIVLYACLVSEVCDLDRIGSFGSGYDSKYATSCVRSGRI
jgi:hypothetical protein